MLPASLAFRMFKVMLLTSRPTSKSRVSPLWPSSYNHEFLHHVHLYFCTRFRGPEYCRSEHNDTTATSAA